MNYSRLYQQGDVLFFRCEDDEDFRKNTDKKACVLVEGEATGHAHVADPSVAVGLHSAEDILAVLEVPEEGGTITHEEHKPIILPKGKYHVKQVREYDPESPTFTRFVRD